MCAVILESKVIRDEQKAHNSGDHGGESPRGAVRFHNNHRTARVSHGAKR